MRLRRGARLGLAVLLSSVGAGAAQVSPIADFRFLGGQHFFEGASSAVSGNADLSFTPAVAFSERWSLLPTYTGAYRGTRDVQELAGGGTLFQDATSHGLNVKAVWAPSAKFRLKPSIGARGDWLREVKGEKWGDGLFDSRRISAGLEGEYLISPRTGWRLSYDHYGLTFPNYQSLESAQDPTLSRELTGQDVLDNTNHLVTLAWRSTMWGGGQVELTAMHNQRDYGDQPVVDAAGSLTGTKRADTSESLGLTWSRNGAWGETPVGLDLGLNWTAADSNQNHYDARKTVFLTNYYDYTQLSVSPRVTLALGETPWILSWGGAWQRRSYAERPTQDADGNYLGGKMNLTLLSTTLGMTYPLSKELRLRMQTTLSWSDSNTRYEKVFRSNYRMADYLVGFSYAY